MLGFGYLKWCLPVLLAAVTVGGISVDVRPARAATIYYVDSINGSDSNDGSSPMSAWRTLAKVNEKTAASCVLNCAEPGDTFSLFSGGFFEGTTLELAQNGTAESPIVVNKYWTGVPPIIANVHPCVRISGEYNQLVDIYTLNCHGINWGQESTIQCQNAIDDDLDGKTNDGCPAIAEAETACRDAEDSDGDGFVNDGCPISGVQPTGVRVEGDNNLLDSGSSQGNMIGVYLTKTADNNRVTNYELSHNTKGDGTSSSGIGINIHGSGNEVDHNTLAGNYWRDPHDPLGNETGAQCSAGNTSDEDADGSVNDGCPVVGPSEESACTEPTDDDADGTANDGCPPAGGGTCRKGDAIEVYGEEGWHADNNNIHHNLAVNNKTFSELGKSTTGTADGNTYTFNVIRSSLAATACSEATGCPDGPNLKGVSGLVTRGGGTHGPVNGTVFNNNTIYFSGACSQGIVCGVTCSADILTAQNTISVAVWKGAYFSGSTMPASIDYDDFRTTSSDSRAFNCQLSGVGSCPEFLHGPTHGTDPLFKDPSTWDLHLQCAGPVSPAVDAGTLLGYLTDYDGTTIPQIGALGGSALADIGAYEMVCP